MLIAILIIVSFLLLISLINTAIMLLLGSVLVQLIEKSRASLTEKSNRDTEKPWYVDM